MKYNNAFNHIASQRDSISATDRYLRDTARDEALIRSFGLTNNYSSYAGYRQNAAQKACNDLDNIKSNHIINLNNKVLSILKGVLKAEEIAQAQNKNISLMSPSVLGNHPLFKQLKQSNPELFAKYNKIIDEVSNPIDAKKQQILKLIQTDYGSQQHVEASQNLFTQTFRVNDYFEYENNVLSAPICKPIVSEIAEEMFEEIKNSIPAENNIANVPDQINSNVQASNANEEQDSIPDISVGVNSAIQNKSVENKKIKKIIENIVDINANLPNEQEQEAISRALQNIQERNSNDSSSDQRNLLQELENLKDKVENHANIIRDLQQNSSSNTSITHPFVEAFSNEASKCFTSAQAVLGGDLRLNENKDIKISIAKNCAKFLPVFGKVVSNVIKMKANKQTRKEIKEKCDKLNDFGITHTILDKWSKKTAKEILNDDDVQELLEDMAYKDVKKLAKEQVSNILTKICSGKYAGLSNSEITKQAIKTCIKYLKGEESEDEESQEDTSENEESSVSNSQQNQSSSQSTSNFEEEKEGESEGSQQSSSKTSQSQQSSSLSQYQSNVSSSKQSHKSSVGGNSKDKKLLDKIKKLEKQLNKSNKLNVEKDNRIKELEEETKNHMDDEEIIQAINSNKQIINDLQQETLEKDGLLDEKDDIIQKQADENGDLSNKLTTANDTIQELKVEKLAKDKRIDKLETRNEKLEVNNDIKDDKIKKLMDELHEERTKNLKNLSDTNSNKTIMEKHPDTISPDNIFPEQHEEAKMSGDFEDFNVDLQ
jgi:DNA repair exonuclease SbcCD ATPase subunit